MDSDLLHVKRYLRARTPDELVSLQIKNNIKRGRAFRYDIVHNGSEWFAWYIDDAAELMRSAARKELSNV